jgi:hypothetical protein
MWATRAGAGDGPGNRTAGEQPRVVGVYAYPDGELAGRDRAAVSVSDDGHQVTRQRPGAGAGPDAPFECDLASMTGMLALEQQQKTARKPLSARKSLRMGTLISSGMDR